MKNVPLAYICLTPSLFCSARAKGLSTQYTYRVNNSDIRWCVIMSTWRGDGAKTPIFIEMVAANETHDRRVAINNRYDIVSINGPRAESKVFNSTQICTDFMSGFFSYFQPNCLDFISSKNASLCVVFCILTLQHVQILYAIVMIFRSDFRVFIFDACARHHWLVAMYFLKQCGFITKITITFSIEERMKIWMIPTVEKIGFFLYCWS